ncbi:MAG: hypothetical protein ACLP3C_30680 [Mycobacterium sp.]
MTETDPKAFVARATPKEPLILTITDDDGQAKERRLSQCEVTFDG